MHPPGMGTGQLPRLQRTTVERDVELLHDRERRGPLAGDGDLQGEPRLSRHPQLETAADLADHREVTGRRAQVLVSGLLRAASRKVTSRR